MRRKISALIFIAMIAALSLAFIFSPKRAYSDNENRYLAQAPEASVESVFDGSFSAGFEDFVTDQFPGRDGWISLKSRLDLLSGRKDTGGVYVTDDGCLIEMFTGLDRERFDKNIGYLSELPDIYSDLESVNIMLVPTAAEIWRDKIGEFTPDIDQKELLEAAKAAVTVDCLSALEAHRDEYIYYKTDHHWTSLGAYCCYKALMGDKALELSDFNSQTLCGDFLGTTFSKAGIYFDKDTITACSYGSPTMEHNMSGDIIEGLYDMSYLDKKDKYSVFLGGNQALTVIKTGNEGGRLLLVKDSYANTLVQFLTPHYSEIHVVDLRSFGLSLREYASQAGITDLLAVYNLKGFSEETSLFKLIG